MINPETAVILENLTTGYNTKNSVKRVSENLNLTAEKGELIFLTGRNGSGKTTLLKTITGDLKPVSGKINVREKEISTLSRAELSKLISVVHTSIPDPGYMTVEEIISLGRAPYTGIRNSLSAEDRKTIEKSVEMLSLKDIRSRLFSNLSDGEKQKTMIARALCQDTEIICMDEPGSHLDFPTRTELIYYLKTISENENKTIIVSSHDLYSALNSGDIMWLMDKNGAVHSGAPEDLALSGSIGKVFNRGDFRFSEETGDFFSDVKYHGTITIKGDHLPHLWTEKGLKKIGIKTVPASDADLDAPLQDMIVIKQREAEWKWIFKGLEFLSIEELVCFFKNHFK